MMNKNGKEHYQVLFLLAAQCHIARLFHENIYYVLFVLVCHSLVYLLLV